jgi:D-alanyl-lipoteichoic acid acyltransferase DltB (MBOAT superfamily)
VLFNSSVFLFAFLPLTLLAFYVLGGLGKLRTAIAVLVLASLFFYGWWNPIYLPLILGSMLTNYFIGRSLQKLRLAGSTRLKPLLIVGITFNLGLLGYFKYANFFAGNLNWALGTDYNLAHIVLPLAISFFTFQQIAYLADVYQGKAQEIDLLRYALFVTFFPQLIAGPIVHHQEMMPQFRSSAVGTFRLNNLVVGSTIFVIGLFKKVVLADGVAPYANTIFSGALRDTAYGLTDSWIGLLAYACQIYFDFSGYSDMAVGLGRMFGIGLPLNFNSPYKASGIIEFWRRWHLTLSRFLRDYLYIPLGGNRCSPYRRDLNMAMRLRRGVSRLITRGNRPEPGLRRFQ